MTRKILVAGHNGQLAQALRASASPDGFETIALGRPDLNLLSTSNIEANLDSIKPDLVINAAAYTAVDLAENNEAEAFALNADAAGYLARSAARHSIPVIHFSTDYVFDGRRAHPYQETDAVSPTGIYGRSKLSGEEAVARDNPDHIILRTAWVYSLYGKNFLKTMLSLASKQDEVRVVNDQIGNPTSAYDLADRTLDLVTVILSGSKSLSPGIFHLTGSGTTSWAGFAEAIFDVSRDLGGPHAHVTPISSSEYKTAAKRPQNSSLDCSKIYNEYGIEMPAWQDSLQVCVRQYIKTGSPSS